MEDSAMTIKQSADRGAEGSQSTQPLKGSGDVRVDGYVVLGDAKELTRNGNANVTEANRGHS
jgi:hypothetical protein